MSFRISGIGEILWDLLPAGRKLGGAPANFAYHARALGADACAISRVGQDQPGGEILERLRQLGLPVETVQTDSNAPTGTVSVTLDSTGHPDYVIHENVAWDFLEASRAALAVASRADAVCFGSLAQRREPSRSSIRALVQATPPTTLRILDVNLRQHYYSRAILEDSLQAANVLKVNETELPRLAEIFHLSGTERELIALLARQHQLRAVAFTRGDRGSLLFSDGKWSDHPGIPATVADTIGAGDSFTAALTLGFLRGWALDEINEQANKVAAFVASQPGATPRLPAELVAPFR